MHAQVKFAQGQLDLYIINSVASYKFAKSAFCPKNAFVEVGVLFANKETCEA